MCKEEKLENKNIKRGKLDLTYFSWDLLSFILTKSISIMFFFFVFCYYSIQLTGFVCTTSI